MDACNEYNPESLQTQLNNDKTSNEHILKLRNLFSVQF